MSSDTSSYPSSSSSNNNTSMEHPHPNSTPHQTPTSSSSTYWPSMSTPSLHQGNTHSSASTIRSPSDPFLVGSYRASAVLEGGGVAGNGNGNGFQPNHIPYTFPTSSVGTGQIPSTAYPSGMNPLSYPVYHQHPQQAESSTSANTNNNTAGPSSSNKRQSTRSHKSRNSINSIKQIPPVPPARTSSLAPQSMSMPSIGTSDGRHSPNSPPSIRRIPALNVIHPTPTKKKGRPRSTASGDTAIGHQHGGSPKSKRTGSSSKVNEGVIDTGAVEGVGEAGGTSGLRVEMDDEEREEEEARVRAEAAKKARAREKGKIRQRNKRERDKKAKNEKLKNVSLPSFSPSRSLPFCFRRPSSSGGFPPDFADCQ